MTNIAIVLIHNKSDSENSAQISTLLSLLSEQNETIEWVDFDGKTVSATHVYYRFSDLLEPHRVDVYQVVPYGVIPPDNFYAVNSEVVYYYGAGNEDKIGDHPRFYNWALKKATYDSGFTPAADLCIPVTDFSTFDLNNISKCINDVSGNCVLDSYSWGKIIHSDVQFLHDPREMVLDESKAIDIAFTDLESSITSTGLEVATGV